jgi:Ca2+-binding RTX toxin-like protein
VALHGLTADADLFLHQQVAGDLVQVARSIRGDVDVDQLSVSAQAGARYVLEVRPFAPQADFALSVALTPAGRNPVLTEFSYAAPGAAPVTAMALGDAMALTGGPANDLLIGGRFDDTLRGGGGRDTQLGGGGGDSLEGGAGDDWLQGGLGGDRIDGGEGVDTATFVGADAAVRADLRGLAGAGEAERDVFVSIENLHGGDFADTLTGDAGGNVLWGRFGADVLSGGLGDDTLDGGPGNDALAGGAGRDRYRFAPGSGADRVEGFEDGRDLLDYSAHPGVDGLAQLRITAVAGGVRIAAGADSVLLTGVNRSQITAADFDFA